MKVQRGIIWNIHQILPKVNPDSTRAKFVIAKLVNETKPEYDAIEFAIQISPEYQTYQELLLTVINSNLPLDKKAERVKELNNKYSQVIEKRKAQIREVEELLKQEITLDLSNFPKLKPKDIQGLPIEAVEILNKLNLIEQEG